MSSGGSVSGVTRRPPVVIPTNASTSAPSAGSSRIVVPSTAGSSETSGASAGSAGANRIQRPTTNSILVNPCQKGNPIINYIRNVAWEYDDILVDYSVGATTGVLYLSLRYHRLHPEYVHGRIAKLGNAYSLRVLLVSVDVDDHQEVLKELTKVSVINNLTIMLAWSSQEAGRYLEIYKSFERKPPDLIKERRDNDYMSHMNAIMTNVRGINKTDVVTLTSNFGSFRNIALASADDLVGCPGLGEKKVKRLRENFTAPLMVKKRKSNAEKRAEAGNALN
ncbi:ssDNA endonuclease and repair protein rad10 [Cystobasidiomycetes sp. EMM_F5]